MVNTKLWLRWSWRDLRARWLQVVAIALIIALGTGVFAGLGGQKQWRIASLDASYSDLNMYDLKMELAGGSYAAKDEITAALAGLEGVETVDMRLVTRTLVDASTVDETILVQGLIVGVDVANGGPQISQLYGHDGRGLTDADAGQNVVVVEYQFARYYHLKPGSPIHISGGVDLDFVGTAQSPEYFMIIPENGLFMGEANYAILFVPLETAQALTGRVGLVNNVVFKFAPGADPDVVQTAIAQRMAETFPATGVTFATPEDDPGHNMLYTDAKEDQRIWDLIAILFLIGAALGAFNLAGRIVESQRRQIGIGMALGLPRRWIAFRPMLVGLQIAVLGTIFGLVMGFGLGRLFAALFKDVMPLPTWKITFYLRGYVQATVFGILLPFMATLIPVWRAVRVAPVDAIRTGNLVAKGGGLSWVLSYVPVPGRSFTHMPFRNILRSPWRSLLTMLGIAMAILLMTAFVGFLDTFLATIDQAEEAYLYEGKDRIVVNLDFFYPTSNGEISAIRGLDGPDGQTLFDRVDPSLLLGGKLLHNGEELEIMLELYNMDNPIWVPKLIKGALTSDGPGIILSEKAADDLGLKVGDTVTLEHPRREGMLSFQLVRTGFEVIGIHNNPIRALSYMDLDQAALMGLNNTTNLLVTSPAPGVEADVIKRALMSQPGVASVQEIAEFSDALDQVLELFVTFLRVVQGIVLVMAFLIAFNSTSINVDERVREISTMFAFGLPIRTVTRMQIVENLVTGLLGTIIGVALGWVALNALLVTRVEDQLADFKFVVTVSPVTMAISITLGVLVVALTPLLSIRRMSKMNIPDTLRVME